MKNTTWLTYGDKKTKTEKSETETYTYGIPVYKYTGIDTALEGAKFILSTNEQPSESNAIKFNPNGTIYRYSTPKGYNKIQKPIKIEILSSGKIKVDGVEITGDVKVLNNKGSLLPSTGGMGTTLIYVVGSILVLASGIVLFSKRKEGTN